MASPVPLLIYATFTSWVSGGHNISLCNDIEGVRKTINSTFDGLGEDEKPELVTHSDLNETMNELKGLDPKGLKDQVYIEWEDTTWMVVQKKKVIDL